MNKLIKKFPDVIACFVLFAPITLWNWFKGESLPSNYGLYIVLVAIWMRLVLIDWRQSGLDKL